MLGPRYLHGPTTVFILLYALGVSAVTAAAQHPPSQSSNLVAKAAPKVGAQQLAVLEKHARGDKVSNQARATALTQVAHEYYRIGDYDKSFALFTELMNVNGAEDSRLDAARMVGQINLFIRNDLPAAEVAYRELQRRAEGAVRPQSEPAPNMALVEAYEKLGMIYQSQKKWDKSIDMRDKFLRVPNRKTLSA